MLLQLIYSTCISAIGIYIYVSFLFLYMYAFTYKLPTYVQCMSMDVDFFYYVTQIFSFYESYINEEKEMFNMIISPHI